MSCSIASHQSTINLHHATTDTMLNANHLVHATLDHFLQAGTQWGACSTCSSGQDSGQRPSSASTSCKPRCLLLAARLQQTRLIEPTLYPNFVVRGLHRTHAGHSQSLNIGCELIAINCVVDGRNKECTSRRTQLGTHRCAKALLQKHLESMRFSGLEVPRGTTLWMHDEHFLASADLHFKVGIPRDMSRGFAPIVHGDRAASTHRAWMVQAKGHWLRLLTKVESCSEPGLALWSALLLF